MRLARSFPPETRPGAPTGAFPLVCDAGLPRVRRLRGLQLRRLRPLANGRQRGQPIVRYYWDRFLEANRSDIRGRCLEIGSTLAIRRYGGQAVTQADGLDVTRHNEEITVVADLSRADHVPGDTYDCFINPSPCTSSTIWRPRSITASAS